MLILLQCPLNLNHAACVVEDESHEHAQAAALRLGQQRVQAHHAVVYSRYGLVDAIPHAVVWRFVPGGDPGEVYARCYEIFGLWGDLVDGFPAVATESLKNIGYIWYPVGSFYYLSADARGSAVIGGMCMLNSLV